MSHARTQPRMHPIILMRHGATSPNLAGLRCGGDLDVPLTELGRDQVADAARKVLELDWPVGVVVASHLQRTRESAAIISRLLGGVEVVIDEDFAERRLGAWNLHSVADTEAALVAGMTPPGGESDLDFVARIGGAARRLLLPRIAQQPLLVGSKGVARAFRELLGMPRGMGLENGGLLQLELALLRQSDTIACHA